MRELGPFIAGRWVETKDRATVRSPWDNREVARIGGATPTELRHALDAAAGAAPTLRKMPAHARAVVLETASAAVSERRDELAQVLVEEAGKPVQLARAEAERCAETFRDAARIARSPYGEMLDLGGFPSGEGRTGLLRRFPIGVVVGISPFNFPLNLVAHKLAPALAAGCPIVLKPASQTPSPALLLAELLDRAGAPMGAVNVVPCRGADAAALLADDRVKLLTFTGSAAVGWELKRRLWDRRVALELGGNAGVIVEPDAGDLESVAKRIAVGAFSYAGQSCISVQRVLVNRAIAPAFRDALVAVTARFPTGDPDSPDVLCGPMISAGDADRIDNWLAEAVASGGRRLSAAKRERSTVFPTVVEGAPDSCAVWSDEVFAPVAALATYDDFEQALAMINASRFGLQAGIFTRDIEKIQHAFDVLEVGGIIQGDIPSWRSDPMPYGGVKQSGVGREGARFAVEEMTEPRLLVLRRG